MRLGERIRSLRVARGLTLQQIGDAIGVTRSAVWDWEKGRSQVPSEELPQIARALGVGVADLFEDEPAGGEQRVVLDTNVVLLLSGAAVGGLPPPQQSALREFVRFLMTRGAPASMTVAVSELAVRTAEGKPEPPNITPSGLNLIQRWPSMSDNERREWLELAAQLRREETGEAVDNV